MAVNPITSAYCCVKTQQLLSDIAGDNAPQNKVLDTYGLLAAIRSQANLSGREIVQTKSASGKARPVTGSNRRVEIEYPVRQCDTVSRTPSAFCTTRPDYADDVSHAEATVDCYAEVTWGVSKSQFRDVCEDRPERMRRIMTNKVNDLLKDINEQLIEKYIAGLGNYFTEAGGVPVDSGAAPKTLNLFNPSTANGLATNALGFMPLKRDYRRSMWSGTPILVGGTTLEAWMEVQPVFQGNNEGLDGTRMGGMTMFTDYQIDTEFGDGFEHLLSFAPGIVQMLEWDAYPAGSDYEELNRDWGSKTTMFINGMSMDFEVRFDECTDHWDFKLSKYFDLFKLPSDSLNTACGQYSNGCLQWLVDCAALDCNYIKL